jgi:hypothetical protein
MRSEKAAIERASDRSAGRREIERFFSMLKEPIYGKYFVIGEMRYLEHRSVNAVRKYPRVGSKFPSLLREIRQTL